MSSHYQAVGGADVARYMVNRDLVSRKSVVDCAIKVYDASRRNRNFRVLDRDGRGFLVKQATVREHPSPTEREGRIYQYLHGCGPALRSRLPGAFSFDAERQILVVELVPQSRSFTEHHLRTGRFSKRLAGLLGTGLALVHHDIGATSPSQTETAPWVLSVHRPMIGAFVDMSAANLELTRMVQDYPGAAAMLDRLRRDWRAETLIHGDLRWDNCLVVQPASPGGKPDLRLVDWELARLGDPAWDIGWAFANYLAFWVSSIPVTGDIDSDEFIKLARYPLTRMQPAMRMLWRCYRRHVAGSRNVAAERLQRSVRYAAASLIQTAYERMQRSPRPTGHGLVLLQLGLNILARPEDAAAALLGLHYSDIADA